jgi:hypothetical protein
MSAIYRSGLIDRAIRGGYTIELVFWNASFQNSIDLFAIDFVDDDKPEASKLSKSERNDSAGI